MGPSLGSRGDLWSRSCGELHCCISKLFSSRSSALNIYIKTQQGLMGNQPSYRIVDFLAASLQPQIDGCRASMQHLPQL